MKSLQITFSNGEVYKIPAEVIALHRTNYYAKQGGFLENSNDWNQEFKQSMKNYELKDWAFSNMNWDDVKYYAKKVENINKIDYGDEFMEGNGEIVED